MFLTIEDGTLVLYDERDEIIGRSLADVTQHLDLEDFMVSSSIDFPEEYTTDPDIITFCRKLRA